jgi:hypothetical protein
MKLFFKTICSLIMLFISASASAHEHNMITITNNTPNKITLQPTGNGLGACIVNQDKSPLSNTLEPNQTIIARASYKQPCTQGVLFTVEEAASVTQTSSEQCNFSIDSNGSLKKGATAFCSRINSSTAAADNDTLTIN